MNIVASRELMRKFINKHPLAVLSTVNARGEPHGTTIYAGSDSTFTLYFLTKSHTEKTGNIDRQSIVALTFSHEPDQATLQLIGNAIEVSDANESNKALEILQNQKHNYADYRLPISKLNAGNYILYKVIPKHASLTVYKESSLVSGLTQYEYAM